MVPRDNTRTALLAGGALALGAYIFYSSYQLAAESTPAHRASVWTGVVALGLLFAMNRLRWRIWVQVALAVFLSVALPVAYSLVWADTPLVWVLLLSVITNVLFFLAVWALWNYLVRRWRWLVAVAIVAMCIVALLVPASRSSIALIVIAVMFLPDKRRAGEGTELAG